jgi:peptide/nickel transport system permease protein
MGLRNYVIRRSILIIPMFFLISIIIFVLIHAAPGDPTTILIARAGPEVREQAIIDLGLDKPVFVQYVMWVSKILRADLGYSFISAQSVWMMIRWRIPHTLELMLAAEIASVTIAIVLGVIAAVKQYSIIDSLSSVGALVGYSIPGFWIALMSLMVFALWLKWLPPGEGVRSVGVEFASPFHALLDHLKHLILPTSILVLGWTAYLFRMVRSSMLDVLMQDYITTARAKGLKERIVIYKHALRNALLPVVTYEGYSVGFLFGGAAVIETIFAWPGLGQLIVEVALTRDYPALMGLSMLIAIMVLIANLCADVAYAVVDPRIRYD